MTMPQRLCDELPWEMLTRKEKWSMCDICDARWQCKDTLSVIEVLKDVPIPDGDPRRENTLQVGASVHPRQHLILQKPKRRNEKTLSLLRE